MIRYDMTYVCKYVKILIAGIGNEVRGLCSGAIPINLLAVSARGIGRARVLTATEFDDTI
jgi:hypothetical protein